MTNKIDTDLIAAYTREVQRVCEKANEQIETLNAAIERLTKDKEFYIIQCQELDKKLAKMSIAYDELDANHKQCIIDYSQAAKDASFFRLKCGDLEKKIGEIYTEIDEKNEEINAALCELESKRDDLKEQRAAYAELLKENTSLKNQSPSVEWHPATETPDGDQRAIVRTEEGATFMYEPVNGKWPKWVVKWMYIPQ